MSVMDERHVKLVDKEPAERPSAGYIIGGEAGVLSISHASVAGKTVRAVTVGTYTLYFPERVPAVPGVAYEVSKRVADVCVASILLLVLFPLIGIVALAVFVEDRGPIFYDQIRVGRNGKTFKFYKFRSMVRNADKIKAELEAQNEATGPIFKMRNDPRITKIGRILRRYSIDELPQLVNVLRGEMSLIGPRPHLPREVALYEEAQRERLSVQPGLLCFREVFGRSNMTFDQWIELDLLYIRYRSIYTDMRILLRTIPAILKAEGAY